MLDSNSFHKRNESAATQAIIKSCECQVTSNTFFNCYTIFCKDCTKRWNYKYVKKTSDKLYEKYQFTQLNVNTTQQVIYRAIKSQRDGAATCHRIRLSYRVLLGWAGLGFPTMICLACLFGTCQVTSTSNVALYI